MAVTGQSSLGTMRLGAARLNYHHAECYITVAGTRREDTIRRSTLKLAETINSTPNTCAFRCWGFTPSYGQDVQVYQGSTAATSLIFGGIIRRITQVYEDIQENVAYDVECDDYTRLLDRRLVFKNYVSLSATAIAQDLISTFTSGFTATLVEAGLPTVSIAFFGDTPSAALTKLQKLIGGKPWKVTYGKVLRFQRSSVLGLPDPAVLTTANTFRDAQIAQVTDGSQLRTRVRVIGKGTSALVAAQAGDTTLPVADTSLLQVGGGLAMIGVQPVTYASVVAAGLGTLVGTGASPSTAPTGNPVVGSGVETGTHGYAITFGTGAGESIPGPTVSVAVSPIEDPGSAPVAGPVGTGGSVDNGDHYYAVTFVTPSGETLAGPVSNTVTCATGQTAAPSSAITATPNDFPGPDNYLYQVTFVTAAGETTGGPTSNTASMFGTIGLGGKQVTLDTIPVGPSEVTARKIYRNHNGGAYGLAIILNDNTTTGGVVDSVNPSLLGSAPPGANTTASTAHRTVSLSSLPISGRGRTTARKLYRTAAGGSQLKLLATISDNTTTTYTDTTADASLGANNPGSNTAGGNQVSLAAILTGPTGTTSRKVYRTVASGSQLKLLTTIADNTTTTYTDTTADASLGANAPSSDTSGLAQPSGQVLSGAIVIPVAGAASFSASGGWAVIGNGQQIVQYTGISANTLTGIPASGRGAITATIGFNSTITAAAQIAGIPASSTGSIGAVGVVGDAVRPYVQRDDLAAQALLASAEGGDGVHEDKVDDANLTTVAQMNAVGDAFLALYRQAEVQINPYAAVDPNVTPGAAQAVSIGTPTNIVGTFTILSVATTRLGTPGTADHGGTQQFVYPLKTAQAGTTKFTLQDLLRQMGLS